MNILRIAGWVVAAEAIAFAVAFVFFGAFCQRVLAALLALSFTLQNARTSFRHHFNRLLDTRTNVQPILVKPGQNDERESIERMVVDALVQQGAARKKAQRIVLELRSHGLMNFADLFRKAAGSLSGRNGA